MLMIMFTPRESVGTTLKAWGMACELIVQGPYPQSLIASGKLLTLLRL